RCFAESLQKALRSMETGLSGLDEIEIPGALDAGGAVDRDAIRTELAKPRPDRVLTIAQALRHGLSLEEIRQATRFDPWFLRQIESLVAVEAEVRRDGLPSDRQGWLRLKKMGFSDARLARLAGLEEDTVTAARRAAEAVPVYKRVDTCAGEFPSVTPYMYSAYEGDGLKAPECEADPSARDKVMILGGGPNRIGQGIEFDYCCVHAAYALDEAGIETIMVNCNPETVSTDYDTSDRLYFEPLTAEDVIEIARVERARGRLLGVIVQFGGQTPLKLAKALESAGIPILGTPPDAIDLAEDRRRFQELLNSTGLMQPQSGTATSAAEACRVAETIGFPVLVRPSYVLGGRAMEIVHDMAQLERYIGAAVKVSGRNPVLIDRYLREAIEVDVDAVADGTEVFIAGVMEHIEEAGIHSGDSACALPPHSLSEAVIEEIGRQTERLARALGVIGLMNVQFAVRDGDIYVLEVNPRASRTVPFVAKATGVPIAKIAARVMAGAKLADFKLQRAKRRHIAVKETVFPFARFPGVDVVLGPEMRSTGEAMGIDTDFARAFLKSQMSVGTVLPQEGTVFISVKDEDKEAMVPLGEALLKLGFNLIATGGTARFLSAKGLAVTAINKVREGRPHIVDAMKSDQVQLVFNTTEDIKAIADSFELRRTALINAIPYYTTVAGARAAVLAIEALRQGQLEVAPLQSYFKGSF
ncbi:MAG TPA: carbamoyl-phosphate synthase large subunit, partial [Kiloniellales bacterium]|nr:carbamoyl-phosphate synthase large subunit [Kiloniellales bacterium]